MSAQKRKFAPSLAKTKALKEHVRSTLVKGNAKADRALPSYRADHQRPGSEVSEAMLISLLKERRLEVWVDSFSQYTPLEAK